MDFEINVAYGPLFDWLSLLKTGVWVNKVSRSIVTALVEPSGLLSLLAVFVEISCRAECITQHVAISVADVVFLGQLAMRNDWLVLIKFVTNCLKSLRPQIHPFEIHVVLIELESRALPIYLR